MFFRAVKSMVRDVYFERYAQKSQNALPKSNMFISNTTKDIPVSEKESISFVKRILYFVWKWKWKWNLFTHGTP